MRGAQRRGARAAALAAAALAAGAGTGAAAPLPGMTLLERAERTLEARRGELRQNLGHYALVFPVEQDDLHAFLAPIGFRRDRGGWVLGTEQGPEGHAGGLLRLLFDHWRPGGRPARAEDRYRFEASGSSLALGSLYAGYREQVVLPEDSHLPRMRFVYGTDLWPEREVETDAHAYLALLLEREDDLDRVWINREGQSIDVERLMQGVWTQFLADRDAAEELADHTNLHAVELLLAYDRRSGGRIGAERIQQRFLTAALERDPPAGDDGRELLAHDAESLGLLLADPRLTWEPRQRARVVRWLRRLEERGFSDPERAEIRHLAHLVRGLRLVREQRGKLQGEGA